MKHVILILLLVSCYTVCGQSDLGPRVEVYPAGVISTLQLSKSLGKQDALNFKVGYNLARRQDFGVHDHEEGGGFGAGAAFRRYLKAGFKGFYAEAGIDLWFLDIDWVDNCITCDPLPATTHITVLQPTLGIGYQFRSSNEKWAATLGLSAGREVNIKTKGAEVGQGGITLGTLSLTRRL